MLGLVCLKGILLVSALINQAGSVLPRGPKRKRWDLSSIGIKICFLKTYDVLRIVEYKTWGAENKSFEFEGFHWRESGKVISKQSWFTSGISDL